MCSDSAAVDRDDPEIPSFAGKPNLKRPEIDPLKEDVQPQMAQPISGSDSEQVLQGRISEVY